MDVDITRIQLLADMLERRTGDPDLAAHVLTRIGLSRQDICPPATSFPAHSEAKFVRLACDLVDDITFAAQCGAELTSATTLASYISKYSRDLRQVIHNATRFHKFIDPTLVFTLREAGNSASLEADWKDSGFARYHRRTEFLLFAAIARMRTLTQTNLFPIEMRFQHQVGKHGEKFEKLAGFPVVFGAEKLEIILSLPTLDLPIPTYDASLHAHLLEYAERLLAEGHSPQQKTRSRVEGLITQSLPGHVVQADQAADSLGMSPRTFARRLKDEGTTYREIVDDLRCDLAQTFIINGMQLGEIAFSLGYADQAAFSNAFKRWTGQAPSAFKNRVDHPLRH